MLVRHVSPLLLVLLVALCCGCSGAQPATVGGPTVQQPALTDQSGSPPFDGGLPGTPGGPEETRDAAVLSGAFKLGNEFAWRHNAPDIGTDLHLIAPEPPGDATAWAYYQFVDTGTQPMALTVNATWLDPEPLAPGAAEGYWVGIADYDIDAWRFLGPVTLGQMRLGIPASADVTSPGGFHYALVLTYAGNQVLLHSLQFGYDAGAGYEEHWLDGPAGQTAGRSADIQLGAGGVPQIAYLRQPAMEGEAGAVAIATLEPGGWLIQEVDTPFPVRECWLALGDGGRRALLLAVAQVANELWLYHDPGTGDFSEQQLITNTPEDNCFPGMTYVNSTDTPGGELDMVVVVYANQTVAWNTMATAYRTFLGGVLSAESPLFGADTEMAGTLAITTRADSRAICGVPDKPADWTYSVGVFSATVPPPASWDFATVPAWMCPNDVPSSGERRPEFVLRELPSGDLAAGYRTYGDEVVLVRYDGALWQHEDRDRHPLFIFDGMMDMEVYSDNDVGLPGNFGLLSPTLHRGQVGIGATDWDVLYINPEPLSFFNPSMAVDATDRSHIAYLNPQGFFLEYMVVLDDGSFATETVDEGALMTGVSGGLVTATMENDALWVFSVDGPHMKPVYSVNYDGQWIRENAPIPTTSLPMHFVGSGYLANEDLVYVAWWDYLDAYVYVASAHPGPEDWEVVRFCGPTVELPPVMADNESEIGVAHLILAEALAEVLFLVSIGPVRTPAVDWELVTGSDEYIFVPWHMAYNPVADQWALLASSDSDHTVNYFRRAGPGVWLGPTTVIRREGMGAHVFALGLGFRESDGMARALVLQRLSGTTIDYCTIFEAPSGTGDFSFINTFASVDDTVEEFAGYVGFAVDQNGDPVAYLPHRLIGDPYYDIEIFANDGTDNWASVATWDDAYSELADTWHGSGPLIAGAVTEDGPAAIVVEMDWTEPTFGRVGVYYPWHW